MTHDFRLRASRLVRGLPLFVLGAALCATPLACGSSSSAPTDEPSASAGTGGSAGSGGSADIGGTSSAGGATPSSYVGTIQIDQSGAAASFDGEVRAVFTRVEPNIASCQVTTSGPCTVHDCSAFSPQSGNAPPRVTYADAGTLTITGGQLGSPLALSYGEVDDLEEYSGSSSARLFQPGDTFDVSASGSSVAAFQGTSAPAPADITLTAPTSTTNSTGRAYAIDEASDLAVSWTGGVAGSLVRVSISTGAGAIYATCDFDAGGGSGTVTSDVLTALGPADGTVETKFQAMPVSTTPLTASNAQVALEVSGTPISGTWQSATQ